MKRQHQLNKAPATISENQKISNEHFKQRLEQLEKSIIRDYGLENLEPLRAKQLIAIGRAAQHCYETLKQTGGENGFELYSILKNETGEEWFNKLPKLLEDFKSNMIEATARIATLDEKLRAIEREKSAITKEYEQKQQEIGRRKTEIEEKKKELLSLQKERDDLKRKVSDLQDESILTTKKLREKQQELANLQNERDNLRRKAETLQAELTLKEEELEQKRREIIRIQKETADLRRKIHELEWIARQLAVYLRQGQRNYLDERNDPETAAILAFLIHHSLSQLCGAIVKEKEDEVLKNAMFVNLYSIARKLEKTRGFQGALEELEKKVSLIASLGETLVRSEERHFDDKLFQIFLQYMRDYARLNFAPFYFDTDSNGKVHFAN